MKKTLLALFCAVASVAAMAQSRSYTDDLTVTINGESATVPNTTVMYQDNGDGTCNFTLKNFVLANEDTTIPVGNISVPNMPLTKGAAYDTFTFNDVIQIEDGDEDAVPEDMGMWFGTLLFPDGLLVDLSGKVNEEKAFVTIYIDLTDVMGQIVEVQFGSDFKDGGAAGKSYTDDLTVTINGESATVPNTTVMYQDNGDGTCNFTLKNFVLANEDTTIPVGNINVPNMPLTKGVAYDTFTFNDVIQIEDGDEDAVPEDMGMWFGTLLFPDGLLVDLSGKVNEEKAFVTIYIDLTEVMGQIVEVQFGSDFQDDEEDAINAVNQSTSQLVNEQVYNLAGQRVQKLQKGINIVNGKKILK